MADHASDPYPQIKSLIEAELEQVTNLQGAVFAGQQHAIQSVARGLRSMEDQLSALEEAVKHMVDNPSKFGLKPSMAYHRQVEVESLRFQATELHKSFEGALSVSTTSPSSGALGRTKTGTAQGAPRTDASAEFDQAQSSLQLTLLRQDEELDHISIHVDRIKDHSLAIHDELESQARLLGGLDSDVDTQTWRIRALKRRVMGVIKESSSSSQLKLIACLSLILLILFIFAVV